MPRTRQPKSDFGRKPGYFEKLKMGTAHETYDPREEGYGNANEWASLFNVRMGFKEAQAHKASRKWGSDWKVIADVAGVSISESSMWREVKAAFRKAVMNCHPDRIVVNNMTKDEADEKFKDVSAAFTMLEDIYTVQGRLTK